MDYGNKRASAPPPGSAECIEAEARRWLMALYVNGEAADCDEFCRWLAASPEHARIYRKLEQGWRDLPLSSALDIDLPARPKSSVLSFRARPMQWLAAGVLAASLLLIVAAGLLRETGGGSPAVTTVYSTAIAELRTVALADGSTVALGPDTRVVATFTQSARAIRLERGSAYFDIAHDAARQLTVEAGAAHLRVLGTAFEVWRAPSGVRLSVVRGRVAVDAGQGTSVRLGVGEQITVSLDGALSGVKQFSVEDVLSWRHGRLVYRDAALSDIVADLNRYRVVPIRIADHRAASLRMTAAFSVNQSEQVLAGLAASQPVVIDKSADGLVIRSAD